MNLKLGEYMNKVYFITPLIFCTHLIAAEKNTEKNQYGDFSLYTEQNYFSWEDSDGNSGYQYAMPLTLSYQYEGLNLGLRRAFIKSKNKSPNREGSVSHWSDTSLSAGYTFNRENEFPVRLNLSMNIPNGKATLSGNEKNAIMDGHLVWQTRFGEGFNITPGVSVSHSFTDKDTVGFGISKIFRGKFDPNGDVEKDEINPGNDTIATLNYSHNDQNWKINSGITYQNSGKTTRGGQEYYKKGDLWSFDLGGAIAFNEKHSLRSNYHYAYRKKDKYINNITGSLEQEQFNSNGATHFINMDYGYRINNKHSIHLIADYLKVKSNDYDEINYLYVPARKKWSIGARYDWAINKDLSLSAVAKRFKVTDKPTPTDRDGKRYTGFNIYANLNYNF